MIRVINLHVKENYIFDTKEVTRMMSNADRNGWELISLQQLYKKYEHGAYNCGYLVTLRSRSNRFFDEAEDQIFAD